MVNGQIVSDVNLCQARWAMYFGQLYTAESLTRQLPLAGLLILGVDPLIDKIPPLVEVREALRKLKGGMATGICNISTEIPLDKGVGYPYLERKGDQQDCNDYCSITLLSVLGKMLALLLLQ